MERVRAYVTTVTVGALAAATTLFLLEPIVAPSVVRAALWLASLGILAQLLAYSLPAGGGASIGFIPFIALALVVPHWIAVVAIAASVALTEYIGKRSATKQLFNAAQMSLAASLGILAFRAAGGDSLLHYADRTLTQSTSTLVLPFAALMVTFVAVNTFAVSGAIGLSQGRQILQVWRQNTLRTLSYDVLAGPVVFLLAWVYVEHGPLGAIVLSVPLLGLRQLYTTNFQLEKVNQELLELMVKAIEARDPYTSGHSRRVAHYSKIIARGIGLGARDV
ncbi:MAG: hypothetical protein ACREON_01020, partial [Gemmatimonadaceae bacterium]